VCVIVLTFPPLPRPDIFDSEIKLVSYELRDVGDGDGMKKSVDSGRETR